MTNAQKVHRIGCEKCDYSGSYVARTRADQNGEPDEIVITCECMLNVQED